MQIFILIYVLGINVFQATGDNSTQMYYFNLTIERSAYNILTRTLTDFVVNDLLVVEDLKMTTLCERVSSGTRCSCRPGFVWSDKVCQSQSCCGANSCTFSKDPAHMCVANTTVTVTGSITLTGQQYQGCLADKTTDLYKLCNINVTQQMQNVYSTLKGFDILQVTNYKVGSVIATFQVIIVSDLSSQYLLVKSQNLTQTLAATMNLETTGVVHISMPPNPVCYKTMGIVKCTSQDDLGTDPIWQLINQGVVYNITNGTQATVTSVPTETSVNLKSITELWQGEYTCAYVNITANVTITHKASAVMDVAVQPNIVMFNNPQYPRCKTVNDFLSVTVSCQTQSNDSYTVSWNATDKTIITVNTLTSGQPGYSVTAIISCGQSIATVQCTFTNRCNQTSSASVNINVIGVNDEYCPSDGVWQDTKAGFTAVLQCTNAAGQRQRNCLINPQWGTEISQCVNQDLYGVLQKAIIVNIGLGSLDVNAATVFSQLQGATNNSQLINSFPNVNVSVKVLTTLSEILQQMYNRSAINDFVTSSSNLLNNTLQNAWKNNNNNNNMNSTNLTLAELYLNSVEQLIGISNISDTKNANIEVNTCSGTPCNNNVFNVNVTLSSSNNGNVKTTGFQQLQNYLPYDNKSLQPNSIIVSTTTDSKNPSDVMITIDFPLLNPRNRNVIITCVAWDNNTRSWTEDGCEWQGANNEGRCICTHLSSFAILMSRFPIELPGMNEITYVGLSVSVMSLLISLIIELTVWSSVVKTNSLYLRHTAHVNISLCLIIADCSFLASSTKNIPDIWCQTFVVLKHFCYLSMFFWMLCLSSTLLHQAVFLFHSVSKKNYLRFSLFLGYVCPFLIVFITFLTNGAGAEGSYYSSDGCWLVYNGLLQGSIFTFIIPVGIIIFVNVFSMLVVIMKLLDHPKGTDKSHEKEKTAAKTVVRTVILLTPIFGLTWSFGFAVMIVDLTSGIIAYAVNYAFTLLNAFQGFFILLTTCLGDRMVREAVLSRFRRNASSSISESTTKLDSSWKK